MLICCLVEFMLDFILICGLLVIIVMVLSGVLAAAAFTMRKTNKFNIKQIETEKIEISASFSLFVEEMAVAVYEYYLCNSYFTLKCLSSLQKFEVALMMLIVSFGKLHSNFAL